MRRRPPLRGEAAPVALGCPSSPEDGEHHLQTAKRRFGLFLRAMAMGHRRRAVGRPCSPDAAGPFGLRLKTNGQRSGLIPLRRARVDAPASVG